MYACEWYGYVYACVCGPAVCIYTTGAQLVVSVLVSYRVSVELVVHISTFNIRKKKNVRTYSKLLYRHSELVQQIISKYN